MRLQDDIQATLFDEQQIAEAIGRLAQQVARDYRGQPLLVLGVLKGALHVTADLVRALSEIADGPSVIEVDFLAVSSYGNSTRSSGEVRLLKDTGQNVAGKNVLIVEDIIDNGLTLQYLHALLVGREPASLRSCVLFDKPYHRLVDVHVEYLGLTAPDEFVVGYGLDYRKASAICRSSHSCIHRFSHK